MPTFEELIKDKRVANHPLLQRYANTANDRKKLTKHSQEIQELMSNPFSLSDYVDEGNKDINHMIREASVLIQDVFSQFLLPLTPKFFYKNTRDLKHARNDENRVVSGSIIFNAEFRSSSGVLKTATVPIPINAGELIPPSVMEVDGRLYVIAQSSIDDILRRNTSYELPQLREGYQSPPLTRAEREIALEMRNYQGYQPRKNPEENYLNQKKVEAKARKEALAGTPRMFPQVIETMEKAEEKGLDTFPRPYFYILKNYILEFVSTASKDAWEPHLINMGFCLNPYGKATNRGRRRAQEIKGEFEKEIDIEVEEPGESFGIEELLEDEEPKKDPRFYPETKTPIEHGDGVKVNKGPGGKGFQGTIVEVDESGDYLIIKSKGMEYRVTVDDIEPMPSTFKKMYL